MKDRRIVSFYVVRSPEDKRELLSVTGVVVEIEGERQTLKIERGANVTAELETVRRTLYAQGFSKRAIASAVKQIKNGGTNASGH